MSHVITTLFSLFLLIFLSAPDIFSQTEWTTWTTADGLPANEIRTIAAGPTGEIWAGTEYGVSCFDGRAWKTYTTADGLANNNVTSIATRPDGVIWFATNGGGISRFDHTFWTTYAPLTEDSTRVRRFSAIAVAPDGLVYAGGSWGLFRFDGTGWIQQNLSDIDNIVFSPDGTGWAGGFYDLYRYNGTAWSSFTYPDLDFWKKPILPLASGTNGCMWFSRFVWMDPGGEISPGITTWIYRGATLLSDTTWAEFPLSDTATPVYVSSAAVDTRGIAWLGTTLGLSRFDGTTWKTYTTGDGLPSNTILALAIDASGAMWVGTDKGVARCTQTITSVENITDFPRQLPGLGNRPNPFNPSTTIEFSLPGPGTAKLAIYDITGRKVRELLSAPLSAGKHIVVWDGRDGMGRPAATGVYFSKLEYGGRAVTAKLMLMR